MNLPTTPSFRLDGRRALVTGAGRGIGLAVSVALADAGAEVTLCARNDGELRELADAIAARGGKARVLPLDISDLVAMEAALKSLTFEILVNNAGTNRPKPITDVTADDFDTVMNLNVRAAYFVAKAVAQNMIAGGVKGSIIQMSSQMGHVGGPRRTLYCTSKWAMEGMTKAMALDLAPHGIRVNTICPTFIETALTAPFFKDEKFRADVMTKIKIGRLGQVEDIMGAVVYLASDASALMTASALMLDGGWTAE